MSPCPGRKASKPKVAAQRPLRRVEIGRFGRHGDVLYLFLQRVASTAALTAFLAPLPGADAVCGLKVRPHSCSLPGIPQPASRSAGCSKFCSCSALAGVAMRMTILAMPPVIPLVHRELHMSETQVGLLVGLPLALFAVAAVPGSLLIARMGTNLAVVAGMVIAALAGAARGAAVDIWTLYAAAIATGFGVAIMQPGNADAGARVAAEPHRARHRRVFGRNADRREPGADFHNSRTCCRSPAAAGGSISSFGRCRRF